MLTQNFTCFTCGNQGHMKADCPKFSKKNDHKGGKELKYKKLYIEWYDNEISLLSDSEREECINLTLMASLHFDDEHDAVSNEKLSYDNDTQESINELLNECKIMYKYVSIQKKQILSLEEKFTLCKKILTKKNGILHAMIVITFLF